MAQPNSTQHSTLPRRSLGSIGIVVLGIVAGSCLLPMSPVEIAHAQAANVAPSIQDLEGGWVRTDEVGVGQGVGVLGAKPDLLPAYAALADRPIKPLGPAFTEHRVHGTDDAYVVVQHPCDGGVGGGEPYNPDSSAIHIVVSKEEVLIVRERLGPRHIFIDGRGHPDMSRWQSTVDGGEKMRLNPDVGDSIGHFENGELVVDTVGLRTGRAPNGGWKTPETHLTERYEVTENGSHLTIHYTWTDPKIYRTPFTYQQTFERLPPATAYAMEQFCDASDPKEQYSIAPPPQE